jgi:cyclophilin family peptidyl-prolyl cis-trans isomerase
MQVFLTLAALIFALTACDAPPPSATPPKTDAQASQKPSASPNKGEQNMQNSQNSQNLKTMKTVTVDKKDAKKPVITITLANDKVIKAELYPDVAPLTVANFVELTEKGFYDGLTFHRIVPGFVIQGGDPKGNGTGGSDKNIKGEFAENGVKNDLKHERGVLSMARSQANDSASSQFFIVVGEASFLDGKYAAFGKVTEGMDAVDEIVAAGPAGGQ